MSKQPRKPGHNVVPITAKRTKPGHPPRDFAPAAAVVPRALAVAGSPQDPRMQEAMRLVEAFLAIEDEQGRAALITLAERLVDFDWVRNAQRR